MLKGTLPAVTTVILMLACPRAGLGAEADGSAEAAVREERPLLAFFWGGNEKSGILKKGERSKAASILSGLEEEAELLFFTKADGCKECGRIEGLLAELSTLSEKLSHEILSLGSSPGRAAELGVEMAPAIVLLGKDGKDYGIRYHGLPLGFEFEAFIEAIVDTAHGTTGLEPGTVAGLGLVKKPVTVTVFVARH